MFGLVRLGFGRGGLDWIGLEWRVELQVSSSGCHEVEVSISNRRRVLIVLVVLLEG